MSISHILTKANIKILEFIDQEPSHIRDIADKLNLSPGKVQQAINLFREYNLIIESKQKNRIEISLDKSSILVKKIKSLINLFKMENKKSYQNLAKIGDVGIYGSYNNGSDDNESDVDMFIITNKKELEVRPLIRELEKKINKQINLILLNKNKIKNLKEKNLEFYLRLKLTSTRGDLID